MGRLKYFGVSVGAAIQRLIFEERVVVAAELQALLVREVHIHRQRVLALVLRVDDAAAYQIWLPLIGAARLGTG